MPRALGTAAGKAKKEELIVKAIKGLQDGTYKSYVAAANALGISRITLARRAQGKTLSRSEAHLSQQILNSAQEKVLASYITFLGRSGKPLSKKTIAPKVTLVSSNSIYTVD
jgi:hypothetical protein